jgi:hypothetical protein
MSRKLPLSTLFAALVLFSIPAWAQETSCDPREHLVRDVVSLDEDLETNLFLLDELLETKSKSSKSSVSGSYAGYSLSGNDARNASSSLKKLLNIKYTERQKRTLFVSALSPKGVEAYLGCLQLNKAHLSVTLSEGAVRKREVLVSVRWHPHFETSAPSKVGALVTGGQVKEVLYDNKNLSSLSEVAFRPQTTITLKLARDSVYEPTEVAGAIDGHQFRIDIPGAPRFRLVTEIKEGTEIKYGPARETCEPPDLSSCVTIHSSDEGILLPGTFQWKAPYIQSLQYRTIAKEVTLEDSHRICRNFTLGCPKLFKNHAHIVKTGTALLVRAVPVKE